MKYKVVQIWPGQTVTCLHTKRPGHIWTTLYLRKCRIRTTKKRYIIFIRQVDICTWNGLTRDYIRTAKSCGEILSYSKRAGLSFDTRFLQPKGDEPERLTEVPLWITGIRLYRKGYGGWEPLISTLKELLLCLNIGTAGTMTVKTWVSDWNC
jgi:hypothetical protein